jgi:hypothetical protein
MLIALQKSSATNGWSFLDWWSFIGTLATLIGLALALIGLYIAYKQIKNAITTAIASSNTAHGMWQLQLGRCLVNLKEVSGSIDRCVRTNNRDEMNQLLHNWMEIANEAYGLIERFVSPNSSAGTDFRSDLGLNRNDRTSISSDMSSYEELAAKLNGSISAARVARSQVETTRRRLAGVTQTCRDKISEIIVDSARFQVVLGAQMIPMGV